MGRNLRCTGSRAAAIIGRMPEARRSRGRTRPGRLAFVDAYLCRHERALLAAAGDAPVVDVGIGDGAVTTAELAAALAMDWPALRVVGVDNDPGRLAAGQAAYPQLQLRALDVRGELSALGGARIVRAMNLLRGLTPQVARRVLAGLAGTLAPGGVLLEGNSDPVGGLCCVQLLRMPALAGAMPACEGLLLRTDFQRGFGPWMFRDHLPRALRHGCPGDHPLRAFFAAWHAAFEAVAAAPRASSRQRFAHAAGGLAARTPGVLCDDWMLGQGAIRWTPPGGIAAWW